MAEDTQTEQATQQVSPMAALLALGGRHEVLDAYYSNRVKVLENDKLLLQARIVELEAGNVALVNDKQGVQNE